MDAVERRGRDGLQILGVLAELVVRASLAAGVVCVHRLGKRRRVDAELLGELLQAVGTHGVRVAELGLLNEVGTLLGEVLLERLRVGGRAAPRSHLVNVVGVEHLRVPAGIRTALQEVALEGHVNALVAEALAVLVHREEGLVEHGAGREVVHHLRMGHGLHLGADPHAHLVAVARLADLLLVQVSGVGTVVAHHLVVVLVIARGEDDALGGVEAHVLVVLVERDDARDAAVLHHELLGGRVVEELDAVLLLGELGQLHDALGIALRRLAVADGVPVCGVLVRGRKVALAHVMPVLVALELLGAIQHVHDGLFAAVGPDVEQGALRAVLALRHQLAQNLLDAGGVALVVQEACRGAALGDGGAHLLQHGHAHALLAGGHGGRDACGAGADDDDVVVVRLHDLVIRDGLRSREEARGAGGLLSRGGFGGDGTAGAGSGEACGGETEAGRPDERAARDGRVRGVCVHGSS